MVNRRNEENSYEERRRRNREKEKRIEQDMRWKEGHLSKYWNAGAGRCDPPSEIYGYPLNLDAGETEAIAGPRNILPNKNLVTMFHLRRFPPRLAFASAFLVSNSRRERKRTKERTKKGEMKISSKYSE